MLAIITVLMVYAIGQSFAQTDPRCPPYNEGLVVHLPHEYDCTKFYKCDWGIPVLFDCEPPGTHWSIALDRCDWPNIANCQLPGPSTLSTSTQTTTSTTTSTTTTASTPQPSTTSTRGPMDPRCPPTNDGPVVHLPHEYDCTKFYKCDWGVLVLYECDPPGTHWSVVHDWCDWPDRANCQLPGSSTLSGSSTTSSTVSTPSSSSTNAATTTYQPRDPRCPLVEDPNNPVHLPHEYDCGLFWKCDNGILVLFYCPGDLHWRYFDLFKCDHMFYSNFLFKYRCRSMRMAINRRLRFRFKAR